MLVVLACISPKQHYILSLRLLLLDTGGVNVEGKCLVSRLTTIRRRGPEPQEVLKALLEQMQLQLRHLVIV